jgi:phenol 2-monooxygenase
MPTYTSERRKHAVRIIRVSGEYLRFVSGSTIAVADLDKADAMNRLNETDAEHEEAQHEDDSGKSQKAKDMAFVAKFFKANGQFLLGVDCEYDESVIAPATLFNGQGRGFAARPLRIKNGVRAPNPRLCFGTDETGYLYDKCAGPARFHLVLFASTLASPEILQRLRKFTAAATDPRGFYHSFGGSSVLNLILVVKLLPFEMEALSNQASEVVEALKAIGTTIMFDDRAPDEDAHNTWGASHETGGVAVIRPDLWVGSTFHLDETEQMRQYFDGFLNTD